MNTRPAAFLVLTTALATLAFAPITAAPQTTQPYAHAVGRVERFGHTIVARGTSISHVERALGAPHRKLSDDVWVYLRFYGESHDSQPRRDDDCSTLLITFTHGRVSDLKLVNDRAEKVFAVQLSAKPVDKVQVAAK